MQAVPLIAGLVASLLLAPAIHKGLREGGHLRVNYRGELLPAPFGVFIAASAALGAGVAGVVAALAAEPVALAAPLGFVLGVAFLGLVDDIFTGPSRGWRGHFAALAKGEISTGALKAFGTLALAAAVVAPGFTGSDRDLAEFALIVLVLVLTTNVFNLVDLRPGRAAKAFGLLALGCAIAIADADALAPLGLFIAPVALAGVYDVRERAMLGDTGSNAIGAIAGLWLVAALDGVTGLAIAAGVLLLITLYGEFRSISALVERAPGLRHLDSLGRIHRA